MRYVVVFKFLCNFAADVICQRAFPAGDAILHSDYRTVMVTGLNGPALRITEALIAGRSTVQLA